MKQHFTAARRPGKSEWAYRPYGVYASIGYDGRGMLYAKAATLDEAQAEADRLNKIQED